MLRPGVTQEWVDEGELPREENQKSEMAGGLRCMIGAAGELDYFSANICLRELGKSEDKAELQRKITAGSFLPQGSLLAAIKENGSKRSLLAVLGSERCMLWLKG
ncbi:hypothetical protein BHE74_00011647 [Ensete ventricosum]|nr:hypothetical protein BHE74_00011647 [Ensete ventricosum]